MRLFKRLAQDRKDDHDLTYTNWKCLGVFIRCCEDRHTRIQDLGVSMQNMHVIYNLTDELCMSFYMLLNRFSHIEIFMKKYAHTLTHSFKCTNIYTETRCALLENHFMVFIISLSNWWAYINSTFISSFS